MFVLVVLSGEIGRTPMFLLKVEEELWRSRVRTLLQEERSRDAFDVVKKHGTVTRYISPGDKIPVLPEALFIEDLL